MPASRAAAAWLLLLARTDALLHTPSFYGVAADTSNLATPSFYGAAAGQGGAVDAPENRPLMIGVAGGTASGKTALTAEILRKLEAEDSVAAITQDSFYRDLTKDELQRIGEINFDVVGPRGLDASRRRRGRGRGYSVETSGTTRPFGQDRCSAKRPRGRDWRVFSRSRRRSTSKNATRASGNSRGASGASTCRATTSSPTRGGQQPRMR